MITRRKNFRLSLIITLTKQPLLKCLKKRESGFQSYANVTDKLDRLPRSKGLEVEKGPWERG